MTWTLVRKLLRDLRLSGGVVVLLLFAFQLLWARITSRITGDILIAFERFGVNVDAIRDIIFQGPGQIIQAIMGGEDVRIEAANDLMTVPYVHPLVITILGLWAVGRAAQALAGELERGTMELLLAQPIRRGQVIAAQLYVDVLTVPVLGLALWLGTWTGAWLIGGLETSRPLLRIEPWQYAPGLLAVAGLLVAVSGLTLWLSSALRSRARVWGIAVSVLLAMFLLNVLGQLWEPLQPLRWFTVYYHYRPQSLILHSDWYAQPENWLSLGVLGALAVMGYVGAWLTFRRRDLPAPL